jgi:hypothetical protein
MNPINTESTNGGESSANERPVYAENPKYKKMESLFEQNHFGTVFRSIEAMVEKYPQLFPDGDFYDRNFPYFQAVYNSTHTFTDKDYYEFRAKILHPFWEQLSRVSEHPEVSILE